MPSYDKEGAVANSSLSNREKASPKPAQSGLFRSYRHTTPMHSQPLAENPRLSAHPMTSDLLQFWSKGDIGG
jgi:hypothetical protein